MKDGTCPKCGSNEVYSGAYLHPWTKMGSNWANSIPITAWNYTPLDNYVCGDCGYVESYVSDPAKLSKIMEKWPRHIPGQQEYGDSLGRKKFARGACPQCGRPVQGSWQSCPHCGQLLV
jgi:predicted nucleic-acid-binding Zn-ribbon protein